jgi:hypothetical protein
MDKEYVPLLIIVTVTSEELSDIVIKLQQLKCVISQYGTTFRDAVACSLVAYLCLG